MQKKKFAWLYLIPAVLLIAIFAYASVRALWAYLPQRREQNEFVRLREELPTAAPEESASVFVNRYESVMEQNGDFACWLKIPDSVVDYPVMKSSEDDPEFYLRRGFDKEYSVSGCLFIGGGCNLDSDSFIIYGHKMESASMFGELDLFADPNYALEHRLILVGTPTEDRIYRVFAAFRTSIYDPDDDVFKYYERIGALDKPTYCDTVEQIRALSAIDLADAPQYPAQLLFLSTCSYHTENGRFVVAAYRADADRNS